MTKSILIPVQFMRTIKVTLFVCGMGSQLLAQDFDRGEEFYKARDYASAINEWRPLAEQGDVRAQFLLGEMFDFGLGIPESRTDAVRWFSLAAEQGHSDAQYNLGRLYDEESDWSTEETLVEFLSRGGVIKDAREAARWYHLAAEQGHARAQFFLGLKYAQGDGVLKDPEEAELWLRQGAEQGNMQFQRNLGWIYANGDGVMRDTAEAVKWYLLAAQQGHPDAQKTLGQMYADGDGVLENFVKAHMWFNIASAIGHPSAAEKREAIEDIMTVKQITEATQLAQTCIRSDYAECD